MKISIRLLLLTILLVILGLSSLSVQASTNQDSSPQTNQLAPLYIDYWTWDADSDGVDDIIEIDVRVEYSGMTGNNLTIFVDIYDANIDPNVFLERHTDSSYQINFGTYYYHITYQSTIAGSKFINVWTEVDGVWNSGDSFTVNDLDDYSLPSMYFMSPVNFVTYDNDGDTFDDAITVYIDLMTQNIVGTIDVYMSIWNYGSWVQQNYREIDVNYLNPNGQTSFDYHIPVAGDYTFDIWIYYYPSIGNTLQLNSTYAFNGASQDTNPPVDFFSFINTYDNDAFPGIDSFSLGVSLDFSNFYGRVQIYVSAYSNDGYWLNDWEKEYQGNGTHTDTVWFPGIFTRIANYTFDISVYVNGDYLRSESQNADFVQAYSDPYAEIQANFNTYDDDGNYIDDTIYFNVEFWHFNLLGTYQVQMNILWWDGVSWIFLVTQSYDLSITNNFGTDGAYFDFNAPFDGDYRFEIFAWYDNGGYASRVVEWYGASAFYGGYQLYSDINYVDMWDYSGDGNQDAILFSIYLDFNFFWQTQVDIVFWMVVYDAEIGEYVNQTIDSRQYYWDYDGYEYIDFEFMAFVEGEHEFHFDFYLDGELIKEHSLTDYYYLYSSTDYNVYWDYNTNQRDDDDDGEPDHLEIWMYLQYENLMDTFVEFSILVMLNGEQVDNFFNSYYFSGWDEHEEYFDFQADENGHYEFIFEVRLNGEIFGQDSFGWDGHRYDPSQTSEPTSSNNESSATPDLPVPAGDFYLFLLAIFSTTILIRRRKLTAYN